MALRIRWSPPPGSEQLGVQAMKQDFFTHGILVDVPWLKDAPYLEPNTTVRVEDLEAWGQRTGIQIESGDVLLVRTGLYKRSQEVGSWDLTQEATAYIRRLVPWLKKRDVATVGSDGTNEVVPSGTEGIPFPIHRLAVVALVMPLLDNLNLGGLAREAQARKRWTLLFIASPLRVPGGTGSPLNPLAVF